MHQASDLDFWKEMAKEEVPPPPIVGGGMVRAFGVKKGNKGGGEWLPLPETVRRRPCFPFCRDGRSTIPPILIGGTSNFTTRLRVTSFRSERSERRNLHGHR